MKVDEQLVKDTRTLVNLILSIQRRAKAEGLWLSSGRDPYLEQTDEAQQGPLVTKMYDLARGLRKELNKK